MATIQTRKFSSGESHRVGYYDEDGKFRFTPGMKSLAGAQKIADIIDKRGYKVALRVIGAKDRSESMTLGEWFEKHLERKSIRLEEGTIAGYRSEAERTWLPRLGDLPIDTITRSDIEEWVRWQTEQETHRSKQKREKYRKAGIKPLPPVELIAPKTIRNAHSTLSSVLDAALYTEPPLIERNPAKKVELPDDDVEEERDIFTREEWSKLYDAMDDHYKALTLFLLVTGCRIGEATATRVGDINPKAGTVSVVQSWKKAAKGQKLGTPKSRRSRRVVMVNPASMAEFVAAAGGRGADEFLFLAVRGGRVHGHRFNERQWHPALEKAGIDKHLTPHSLRHTFASWQLMAGVPPQVVQMRLGHSNLTTTSKVYAHLLIDAQQSGADVMAITPAEIDGEIVEQAEIEA